MAVSHQRLPGQPLSSLATKIIIFVFASTLATAVLVGWTSIQSTHSYLRRSIDRGYPAALSRAAERARTALRDAQAEIEALAGAADFGRSRQPSARRLRTLQEHSRAFSGLELLAADGALLTAAGEAPPLPEPVRVRLASGQPRGVRFLPSEQGGPAALAVAPVALHRGRAGILVGRIRGTGLSGLLATDRPDSSTAVFLVDGAGRVAIATGASDEDAVDRLPLPALLVDGAGAVREYRNARGVRVIGAARPVGLESWHVALETPFEVAFGPALSVVRRVVVVDLCIVLLFSVIAFKITRAVVRPIENLADGARRIAAGHLELEVPEPRTHDELALLTRAFNEMMGKLREYRAQIEIGNRNLVDRNLELRQAKEAFEQLSITDGLTRLHNHRFFQDQLTREIKRVSRTREPLAMLLVDIDDFKSLNDRFGHAAGDELLVRIAQIMNESVRESDLLARYGGEEFVVLTTGTGLPGAVQLAEKIRTSIAETSFILEESLRPNRVSVSIGVAQYGGNRKAFFQAADRALYRAKDEGKNCVVVDDAITAPRPPGSAGNP